LSTTCKSAKQEKITAAAIIKRFMAVLDSQSFKDITFNVFGGIS
jgi:hypothetical protein